MDGGPPMPPLPHRVERDRRFAIQIAVDVGIGRRTVSALTDNVGANGLFVRSDVAGELRQLITMDLHLGFSMGTLRTHGMIVHVVSPGGTRVPGMGVALYGLDDVRRDRWAAFVRAARKHAPEVPAKALLAYRVDRRPPEPIRRRYERFEVVLELQVQLVEELVTMYTHDISRGGMLLRTDCDIEPGDGLVLRIVHPRRHDTLSIPCVVRRRVVDEGMRGIGVEFLDLDDETRAMFWEFVGAEIEEVDGGPVVLIED